MPLTASLPMYNLPEMRPVNTAFWAAIAESLHEDGIETVPDRLDSDRASVPERIGPEVIFTQTCGYPLQTIYRGQFQLLGIPSYDAPGCDAPDIAGPSHCAFFLVREDDPVRTLADLRGRVFACNSPHSNSGMNLPRRSLAQFTGGKPFFARVVETGGHGPSMQAVKDGKADVASIDNMTFVFHADYRPSAIAGLRVLARTVPSPAIPFVTSIETGPATVAALRRALTLVMSDPQHAETRRALRLRAVAAPEGSDYAVLLRYEQEAASLGYPELV